MKAEARRVARTVLRVMIWAVLYVLMARGIAMGVGIWAAGTMRAVPTLVVALVFPIWLFLHFPSWFAWRVAHPLGLRFLVRWGCWLSPLARSRDLTSIAIYVDVDAGEALPARADLPADAWTALAAAREAERLGDRARADQIVDALAQLPPGGLYPWMARSYGVERLIAAALRRGDPATATQYARIGAGALSSLLATLTASDARPAWRLWALWAAAPCRRLTLPRVRAAARRSRAQAVVTSPLAPMLIGRSGDGDGDGGGPALSAPPLRHLQLLAAAAAGRPVPMRDLFALAGDWERALDEPSRARVHARALELGARQGAERARALRNRVIAELAVLAERADGDPPRAVHRLDAGVDVSDGPVTSALRAEVRARLLDGVAAALAPLGDGRRAPPGNVLAAWERWLAVRAALDRAEAVAGPRALTALWYGGVRDAVWSWSCALYRDRRARSGWAAHMMFSWIADRAELYGDFPATLLNRENARNALAVA